MDAAELIFSAALCLVYCAACQSLGAACVRRPLRGAFAQMHVSPPAQVATEFFLGQGILANAWLLLALAGWLSPFAVVSVAAAALIIGARAAWRSGIALYGSLQSARGQLRRENWIWKTTAGLCLLSLAVLALEAFAFPISDGGDAAAFYMALPKLTAHTQRLLPLPLYEEFTEIGLQGEMHFAALMSLGAGQQAKWFVWPTALATIAMLLALGRMAGLGRRGQWIALIIVCTSTAFMRLVPRGKVDLFGAAMGVAAFYWAMHAGGNHRRTSAALAGTFAGLAVIAKFSLLAVVPPGVALLVYWQARSRSAPGDVQTAGRKQDTCTTREMQPAWQDPANPTTPRAGWLLVLFACCCAVPAIPHVLKNTALFGEPLAPLVTFGESQAWLNQSWLTREETQRLLLTYPLALVFGGYPMTFGTMSLLLLALAPLVLLLPRARPIGSSPLARIAAVALLGVALWTIARPSVFAPRYILPALLLLILPVARAAEFALERLRRRTLVVAAGVCCVMIAEVKMLENLPRRLRDTVQFASGRKSRFVKGPRGRAMEAVNRHAASGERVYLSAYQRYWLRSEILATANNTGEQPAGDSPEDLWADLYRRGFRLVVVDEVCQSNLGWGIQLSDIAKLPGWLTFEPIFQEKTMHVFRLRARRPARIATRPEL